MNDDRFLTLFNDAEMKGVKKPMCYVLDGIEKAGEIKGKIELLLEMDTPINDIIERLGVSEEYIQKVKAEMEQEA